MSQNVPKKSRSKAAQALARGESARSAAIAGGVERRTITRWLADPTFAAMVDRFQAGYIARTTAKLARASGRAVATLERLLGGDGATALGAARGLLEYCRNFREASSVEKRLAELESRFGMASPKQGAAA